MITIPGPPEPDVPYKFPDASYFMPVAVFMGVWHYARTLLITQSSLIIVLWQSVRLDYKPQRYFLSTLILV